MICINLQQIWSHCTCLYIWHSHANHGSQHNMYCHRQAGTSRSKRFGQKQCDDCTFYLVIFANAVNGLTNVLVYSHFPVWNFFNIIAFVWQIAATTWIISFLIMGINIYYLAEKLVTSLRHSKLSIVGIVFCGLLGLLAMLVYLASVAYLVIRKNQEGSHLIALSDRQEENVTLPRQDIANMQLPQTRTSDHLWTKIILFFSFDEW